MTVLSETKLHDLEAAKEPPAPKLAEIEAEYVPREVPT